MMFSEKYRILTKDGYKEIGNLAVGDTVITDEGETTITKIIGAKKKKARVIGELNNGVIRYL